MASKEAKKALEESVSSADVSYSLGFLAGYDRGRADEQAANQAEIEKIMTKHWDMRACDCALCIFGRSKGWAAQSKYLPHNQEASRA